MSYADIDLEMVPAARAHFEKPAGYFLPGADFGECAVAQRIEIDLQRLLIRGQPGAVVCHRSVDLARHGQWQSLGNRDSLSIIGTSACAYHEKSNRLELPWCSRSLLNTALLKGQPVGGV